MNEWCKKNCTSNYVYPNLYPMGILPTQQYYFQDSKEAMLFKLKFS
jgi:hypothetical protein